MKITALEDEIEAYVEEETGKDPRKNYVLIKGAKGVRHKHIATTAKAAARVAQITNMGLGHHGSQLTWRRRNVETQ